MKNKCFFCQFGIDPNFLEPDNLQKFLSARKKIASREISGICAGHQRMLTKHVKYAQFMGLLPYISHHGA